MSLPTLLEIQPRSDFKLWLRYSDGSEGLANMSHLAGKGVFKIWDTPGEFEKARLDSSGAVVWGADIDVCPDALYFRMTGVNPEEYFATAKPVNA